MDMHLTTQPIAVDQPLGQCQSQAIVEGEMTLPGGLREETHVLQCGGTAVVESAEALQDRVNVGGRVVFHVLYTQGDPAKVNSIEAAADFTHLCDLPGAQARSSVFSQAQVERTEASVSGNKLIMRAVVRIDARALSKAPVEAVTAINAADTDIQTKTHQTTLRRTVSSGSGDVLLREEFPLPEGLQIRETLYATAFPQVTDVTGGLGRIGMNGQVSLEAVHASTLPGKPIVTTRHTLPIEQSVEVTGENGDLLDGRAVIKDVAVASQDMGDGERVLRVEVLLGLEGWADAQETVTLLDDAYTTSGDDLRLTSRTITARTGDDRAHAAESGKAMLMLPEGTPPVRGALAAFATPVLTGREQTGGRLTLEGRMSVTLLYMTDDADAPVSVTQDAPFRTTFAVQTVPEDFLAVTVADVDVTPITSDRVEMRYVMHLDVEGVESAPVRVVTDAQPVAADAPTGDIVLYFTQPGEGLWDIARRYRVPIGDVKALNPELTGEPTTGQGIVVWKRQLAVGT